jgi:hypothetical protein
MRLLLTAVLFLAVSIPAQAGHRHHHHRHHTSGAHRHTAHRSHHHAASKQSAHRSHQNGAVRSLWGRNKEEYQRYQERTAAGHGMVRIQTAAGPITVASHLADRFQALIADFVAHGYKPRNVGCLANGGHVPNSRHYSGAACDFDQRGWGLTHPFMYHAHDIIKRHGFRDGCSFNDCGHVDDGLPLHRGRSWASNDDDSWFN